MRIAFGYRRQPSFWSCRLCSRNSMHFRTTRLKHELSRRASHMGSFRGFWVPGYNRYTSQPNVSRLHTVGRKSTTASSSSSRRSGEEVPSCSVDCLFQVSGKPVGVWIPKAKQGPTADFFRPLGMPDTLDRLQDGTVAAILFRTTRHSFHPAQTLLNAFREPQRAVLEVQRSLEGEAPAPALFADVRVKPYFKRKKIFQWIYRHNSRA